MRPTKSNTKRRRSTLSKTATISEAEVDSWTYEPIRWARKFGGERFDPWSGQEECWHEYGKLLNAKIKRCARNVPTSGGTQTYVIHKIAG